jgi:pimeloyl-ACP methyl ester carboxylesterase
MHRERSGSVGFSGEEIALEIDSAGSLSAVICCHGFCSERTSDGRFLQLSETLTARGFDVIRFDFRGCGDSADAVLTETSLLDDLLRVLRFAKERGYHRLFLHGHSLGSYLCMAVCSRYPGGNDRCGSDGAHRLYDRSDAL